MKNYTIDEIKNKLEMLTALKVLTRGTVIADDIDSLIESYSQKSDEMQNVVFYKDCRITRDSIYGKYKILAGGHVAVELTKSTSPSIRETWEKLKGEGYFDETGLICREIAGYSASTTISIIAGCNMSGPKILGSILW